MAQRKWVFPLAAALLAVTAPAAVRVDCWWEAPLLAGPGFSLDYVDKRAGDFSMVYRASAEGPHDFGFTPGPFIPAWALGQGWSLNLWMKAETAAADWPIVLIDSAGRRAEAVLEAIRADGSWHEIELPLRRFRPAPDFDFSAVSACRIVSYRKLVFNAANNDVPTIGGRYVEYAPANVFESPFLESRYGSGVVEVRRGREKLVLDFREDK